MNKLKFAIEIQEHERRAGRRRNKVYDICNKINSGDTQNEIDTRENRGADFGQGEKEGLTSEGLEGEETSSDPVSQSNSLGIAGVGTGLAEQLGKLGGGWVVAGEKVKRDSISGHPSNTISENSNNSHTISENANTISDKGIYYTIILKFFKIFSGNINDLNDKGILHRLVCRFTKFFKIF